MKLFNALGPWLNAGERETLASLGWEIVEPGERYGECPEPKSGIDAVLTDGRFPITGIEGFTSLRFVVLNSAGFDGLQTDWLKEHGVKLYNARGVYSAPIAEFVLLGVLELYKKVRVLNEQRARREWRRHHDLRELTGKTVCIVGAGSIGTECAKRFRAMDCRVLGVSRSGRIGEHFDEGFTLAELDSALALSDVVVLALPLNAESEGLFGTERFEAMKPGAVLVNIARGPIVRERELIEALKSGLLAGAAIDVFEKEPLSPDSELWDMENVFLTPHNSFAGDGVRARLGARVMRVLTTQGEGLDEAI